MDILYAVSEAYPYAKNGGLGDVAGSYPKALAKKGVDIRVILPLYDAVSEELHGQMELISNFTLQLSLETVYCGLHRLFADGVTWYFIENDYYFYGESFTDLMTMTHGSLFSLRRFVNLFGI